MHRKLSDCLPFLVATTHDHSVFSFYPDPRVCHGFEEALARYREIVPYLKLSGFFRVSLLILCSPFAYQLLKYGSYNGIFALISFAEQIIVFFHCVIVVLSGGQYKIIVLMMIMMIRDEYFLHSNEEINFQFSRINKISCLQNFHRVYVHVVPSFYKQLN